MTRLQLQRAVSHPASPFGARADGFYFCPGDHVRVGRFLYSHHAIVESPDTVIEFGGGLQGGCVQRTSLDVFADGGEVELVQRGGHTAVERARGQLGRTGFDLISRNCEHFASWCATGRWESSQVQVAVAVGALALLCVLVRRAA